MKRILSRRAQVDVIAFVGVVVALLILAPIMLKIVNQSIGGFATSLNSTSVQASAEVSKIHGTFTTMWDWLIALAFMINIIMLFVFAFLVESHPIFSLFYLISAVFTLIFAHYVVVPIETILGMSEFSTEVLQLPITGFIVQTWDIILLGVIIVTGIIMYGKLKSGGLQQ